MSYEFDDNNAPEKICVEVSWEDIALGTPGHGDSCAIARALVREIGGKEDVNVESRSTVTISGWDYYQSRSDEVDADDFINAFDTWSDRGNDLMRAKDNRPRNLLGLPAMPEDNMYLKPTKFCFIKVEGC